MAVNDAWTGMLAISLLALMTGAGFLGWDYLQYYDDNPVPKPPYLTGKGPGIPVAPKQPDPPKEKGKDDDKKKDDKKDDKKDAALRKSLQPLCYLSPSLSARTRRSPTLSDS